jgi:Raf kinase inhibitor-like YbhB/YbcL family protein
MPQVESGKAKAKAKRLEVRSSAFSEGERIPETYTADGDDVSPPLRWGDPPAGTRSFAIVCEDPDAPSGVFVHWTAWNIRDDQRELKEAVAPSAEESGITQGRNDFGRTGYGGPRPPRGKPHRYMFRVHALDTPLGLPAGASRSDLTRAIEGHVLAAGVLVGKYER